MPLRTQVLVRGDVSTMSTLTRWAARAGNSIPAMEEVIEYMEEREKELFATEGASAGRPWQQLEATTLSQREREGEGDKILQATGALMRSLTEREAEGAIREVGPGFVRFGSTLRQAAIQARAHLSRGGKGNVPARRPIDWTARDRYVIGRMIMHWVTSKTRLPIKPSIRTYRGPFL